MLDMPASDDRLRARKMEEAWTKTTGGNFSLSEYKDSTGRRLPMYQLNKTECLYVATKFNDEARATWKNYPCLELVFPSL